MINHPKLIIFDLDNSLTDWISMFALSTERSIQEASKIVNIPYQVLCEEYKQVIDKEENIEHPFVIQQLPSVMKHYNYDFDKILTECAEPARQQFKLTAYAYLKPYPTVLKTLQKLKSDYPNTKLVVLTDAPCQIALHRLNKLGILNYFDGVYGLENPKLPIVQNNIAVTKEILLKNLDKWKYGFIGRIRELPNDYKKPSSKGFKNVLLDFNIGEYSKQDIVFIGDNVYKDIQLANDMNVISCLALYGLEIDPNAVQVLKQFAPDRFIHKGIDLKGSYPEPTHRFDSLADLITILDN